MENSTIQEANHQVLVILLKKILEVLSIEDKPVESVSIDNFDEVRASLRNELSAVVKSIKSLPDNTDIIKELKTLTDSIKKIEFTPTINVAAATVTVPEIKVPEVNIPAITVPTPQVTVNTPEVLIPAPIVNVPAPIVNVEAVDLSNIIKSLELNLNKLRTNSETRPLAVRMSDGSNWIRDLIKIQKETSKAVAAFAGGSDQIRLLDSNRSIINPASLEGQSFDMLVPYSYDYIDWSNLSAILFKKNGITVSTLSISGSTITRT